MVTEAKLFSSRATRGVQLQQKTGAIFLLQSAGNDNIFAFVEDIYHLRRLPLRYSGTEFRKFVDQGFVWDVLPPAAVPEKPAGQQQLRELPGIMLIPKDKPILILVETTSSSSEVALGSGTNSQKHLTAKPITKCPPHLQSGGKALGISVFPIEGERAIHIGLIFEDQLVRYIWLGLLTRLRLDDSSPVEHLNTVVAELAITTARHTFSHCWPTFVLLLP